MLSGLIFAGIINNFIKFIIKFIYFVGAVLGGNIIIIIIFKILFNTIITYIAADFSADKFPKQGAGCDYYVNIFRQGKFDDYRGSLFILI